MIRAASLSIVLALCASQGHAGTCARLNAPQVFAGTVTPTPFRIVDSNKTETFGVLVLDHPLRLCEALDWYEEVDAHTVRRMQLIFFAPPFGADWNGRHVSVGGTPFAAENANHHTPVMLQVKTIKAVP